MKWRLQLVMNDRYMALGKQLMNRVKRLGHFGEYYSRVGNVNISWEEKREKER